MIVDPDFLDHWKTRLLIGALDDDQSAPIYVLRLWAHCQNRRQSVFDDMSAIALKALCRFPGHANKLESSLSSSGFIRRDGNSLTVCNWDEYNSSLIAAWKNGKRGGRPSGSKPGHNPDETQPEPTGSRLDGIRVDRSGSDKKEDPPAPSGSGDPKRKRKQRFDPMDIPIPEQLENSSGFVECWSAWCQFRKELGKPMTPTQVASLLSDFVGWGSPRAIAAMRYTIHKGWQGLAEPPVTKQHDDLFGSLGRFPVDKS